MARHDPSRTGTSQERGDLRAPAIVWRHYLGGGIEKEHLLADDIDGDGVTEVVFLTAGRLVARLPDDTPVWDGESLDLFRIDGVSDFDGDGVSDIVATSVQGFVAIIDGGDGSLTWRTSPEAFGSELGAVRFADFDGDGLIDLYVADLACDTPGSLGDVAIAYSFASGFGTGMDDGVTQRLWQLEGGREYACGQNDVVADLDGDGRPEVVTLATGYAYLYDGRTGAKIDSGDSTSSGGYALGFPIPHGRARTQVADLDGDGGLDIVCYSNNAGAPGLASRAVFVLSYDPARARDDRLYLRWAHHAEDASEDIHAFVHDGAADLDNDGRMEVTTTFRHDGVAMTVVLDGADGHVLAELETAALQGIFRGARGGDVTLLLVSQGGALMGYELADPESPVVTLPALSVCPYFDRERWSQSSAVTGRVTVPLASGAHAIALRSGRSVHLWDVSGTEANEVAAYTLPMGVAVDSVVHQNDVALPGPGLLVVRSDGYLVVLDEALDPINYGHWPMVSDGLRTGGYFSGVGGLGHVPVASNLEANGAVEHVVVRDSTGILFGLDVSTATLGQPPRIMFEWPAVVLPLLADVDGDGLRDIVARDESSLYARRVQGDQLFSVRVTTDGQALFGDVVPLLRSEGDTALAVLAHDSNDGTSQMLVYEPQEDRIVRGEELFGNEGGPGCLCVDDIDQDGNDDALAALDDQLELIDGTTGAVLARHGEGAPHMPIGVDDPHTLVTHIAVGGERGATGLRLVLPIDQEHPFETVWSLGDDHDAERLFGCLVPCEDGRRRFVTTRHGQPEVSAVDALTGRDQRSAFLAGGSLFPDEDTLERAGERPGTLGNTTAVAELWTDQAAVLVGGTDGFLYALDPCGQEVSLLWSMFFSAPVGEAILSDTDGDGFEEIVVTVGDGYIYGIDGQTVGSPAHVYDVGVDADGDVAPEDVDEVYGTALGCVWAAVDSAEEYEWSLLDATFELISSGVTADLATVISEGLEAGQRYTCSVRAREAGGEVSPERLSDGVRFYGEAETPGGDSGPDSDVSSELVHVERGCGCRMVGTSQGAQALQRRFPPTSTILLGIVGS